MTATAALLAAGAVALGGAAATGGAATGGATTGGAAPRGASGSAGDPRTALVIDASLARDGRELVDPRLEATEAEVRLPRTADEARTNVRYFTELGYRVVTAGPDATAAADTSGAYTEIAPDLPAALAAARR